MLNFRWRVVKMRSIITFPPCKSVNPMHTVHRPLTGVSCGLPVKCPSLRLIKIHTVGLGVGKSSPRQVASDKCGFLS